MKPTVVIVIPRSGAPDVCAYTALSLTRVMLPVRVRVCTGAQGCMKGRFVRARSLSVVRVIAGLGNPGPAYTHSRHNAGFMVLDRLARSNRVDFGNVRQGAVTARLNDALLVKPVTFMNLSGGPVATLARYYKVDIASKLLIVSDDVALLPGATVLFLVPCLCEPDSCICALCFCACESGAIRFARSGGAGGQNGMGTST